jgi:hypothetical protein
MALALMCSGFKLSMIIHIMWSCIEFQPLVSSQALDKKVMKGNNSVISQDEVIVLVHCTFSQCAWPLHKVI